jgi:hypothetical protein
VQRIVALRREIAIYRNQILNTADFGAEDDLLASEAVPLGRSRRFERAHDDRVQCDGTSIQRFRQKVILIHHPRQQRAVE